MRRTLPIKTVFIDVGGVLLTNGWDHLARKRAAKHFQLDWSEMDERHRLVFETHEEDRLTFEQYLGWVVFYEKRPFERAAFRDFMFAQSRPFPRMIELFIELKSRYGLKVVVVSNESRAVNAHRIRTFELDQFVDTFVSSCFVQMRKPDVRIFELALDLAQTPPSQSIFIDNTQMFVEIATGLGMHGILHVDYASTCAKLAAFGLKAT
jgi:HAD superfamily hydrolase (TIGR01509 family)